MALCLASLGSNLGRREENIRRGIELLAADRRISFVESSGMHRTRAIGGPAEQGDFLNAAATIETESSPAELLRVCHDIEKQLGRQRAQRWEPRTLDVDLLLYDDVVLDTPLIQLPHPRMAFRRFVLQPAAEIAAEMIHPTTAWTIGHLLHHLNSAADYVAIAGPPGAGKTRLAREVARQTAAQWIADAGDTAPDAAAESEWPNRGLRAETTLLERRRNLLAQVPIERETAAAAEFAISDFWLDQSLAYGRTHLAPGELEQLNNSWGRLCRDVVAPKLLVVLDAPSNWLLQEIASQGGNLATPTSADLFERLRRELRDLASRPNQGPVLWLDATDPQWAVAEVSAAIAAMR